MSPAMVEVRTPAVVEAEAEARNPSDKGQIFAPLIDKPSTFTNQQREENPNFIKSMDQPNPFQCPPASSSGKPALIRPRFNKQRRNTANRKPAPAAAAAAAAAAAVREADKIEEKINSWNPFAAESGAKVSEGTSGIGGAFGGLFGFGPPVEFGSSGPNFSRNSSGRSVGSFDSVRSEGSQFVSGSKLDIGGGVVKNDDLRSGGSSPLGSDEGSVFSNLPAELSKLDIKNLDNGDDFEEKKQAEIPFASGANSVESVDILPENAEFAPGVGMGKQTAGSVPRSGVKKSVNWNQNSSFGSDEGSSSKLRDEMGKLNINVDEFGKKKQTEPFVFMGGMNVSGIPGSSSGGAEFISGSISGSQLINEESGIPTAHSVSLGSEQPSSKLPAEMKNLNLNSNGSVDNFEKNKQAGNNFVSGGSKTGSRLTSVITPESAGFVSVAGAVSGLDKPTADSVIFGSKGSGSAGSSAFIFSSGVKESVDLSSDDGFQKTKTADNVFVGSNKDATGSFSSGFARKVPEETGKFNVGGEKVTQGMMNEGAGSAAGVFVSVSSTDNSAFSRFDNGMAFNIPADKNLSSEGFDKGKEMGCKLKGDKGNVTSSLGGSAVNTVRDHMEKLKIGTNAENLAGRVPFKFNLQTGIEDHITNMGSIPSTPAPVFQSPGPRFSFTANSTGLETPHMEFKTPQQDATRLTKETLFTESYQNPPFRTKKGDAKSTKLKKKRDKIRQPAPVCESFPAQFVLEESCPQVESEADSTGGYSPMDYSPYHEDVVADQYSREPSIASEDSIPFVFGGVSVDTQRSVSCDEREEVLVSEAQRLNINEGNLCQGEVGNDGSKDNDKRSSSAESAYEQTNKLGTGSDMLKHENVGLDNDSRTAPMQAETGFSSSNIEQPAGGARTEFTFSSNLEDLGESSFAFTALPFGQGPLPTTRHYHRRKNRLKSGQNSSVSTPNARGPLASPLPDLIPRLSSSGLPDSVEGQQSTSSIPRSDDEIKTGKSKDLESRQESTSSATATVTVQEACEKWRFRGNQAYAKGHMAKAEDYYTRGVNSAPLKEIPSSCIRPLTLCFSNRAATRMSLGKLREALSDCMMAVSIDPNFLKARVRVANCHLALGEIGEALKHFKKCLQSERDISSDQKYLIEASDGLQKAQHVADLTGQSAELLLRRTFDDACKSLNMISEALSISPHSESLLEMKAEALLMMRNYEEVIKLCEHTLDLAEQNSAVTTVDSQFDNKDLSEHMKSSPARLWRWRLIAKSYFCLGKLEEALVLIRKHEKLKSAVDKSSESSTSFAVTVQELLRLKSAGNEAFQAGRHLEAVECYTSALACSAESRPFTAVCFCNRAAAYQALGQITDAIADCSHAIALDPTYPKAISRRATLHEMIRDYGQAAHDLNRLISLLKKQMEGKDNQSTGGGRSTANGTELKRALVRLATVEEEARKGISLDMYMILGIEPSSSAADLKKAYRKAALRHHPDKAGQFVVRNENVDDGLWREVAAEVHADADRLFKMIGEAYTILSDTTKRLQYDDEEEMRAYPMKSYSGGTPRTSSDTYSSSHHEKSFNRRQWRPHGSSYQRYY